MKHTTSPGESKKVSTRHAGQPRRKTGISEIQPDPLVNAQFELRETYHEYELALTDFENAFKDRERKNREAFVYSERKYKSYHDAVETVFHNREKAEYAAIERYRKAIEHAQTLYAEDMKKALADCKRSTDKARSLLAGISAKEVEPGPRATILFSLPLKGPDLEPIKQRIISLGKWINSKNTLMLQKLHRIHPQQKLKALLNF